jgi:hypothetical protein
MMEARDMMEMDELMELTDEELMELTGGTNFADVVSTLNAQISFRPIPMYGVRPLYGYPPRNRSMIPV